MTQLDRLEALADLDSWLGNELREVRLHLPDLIRVARAADMFCHGKFIERDKQLIALNDALAPLFSEVES